MSDYLFSVHTILYHTIVITKFVYFIALVEFLCFIGMTNYDRTQGNIAIRRIIGTRIAQIAR